MSSTIEDKCIAKGVKLTEQRKIIAKVISESKELYGYKDSSLDEFKPKNIELLIKKNLLENNLIKPVYMS